jgi:hypothetical protein
MSGKRRLFQHSLHQSGEPLKATPQISEPGGYSDRSSGTKFDHRNKLSSTARTSDVSTPASTLTNAWPGNSMWICPDGTDGGETSGTITLLGSAANVTGSKLARVFWAAHSAPLRYSCRHWNTWLAFTPCSRATRAIDAPGTSVASTIRRFSSAVRRKRFAELLPVPTSTISLTTPASAYSRSSSIRP